MVLVSKLSFTQLDSNIIEYVNDTINILKSNKKNHLFDVINRTTHDMFIVNKLYCINIINKQLTKCCFLNKNVISNDPNYYSIRVYLKYYILMFINIHKQNKLSKKDTAYYGSYLKSYNSTPYRKVKTRDSYLH